MAYMECSHVTSMNCLVRLIDRRVRQQVTMET